jgi:hypothetical protein
MSTIVVDAATKAKILAAGGVAEVRDENGELIGRFYAEPEIPPPEVLAEMEMTAEEYRRAFAPGAKTYTTAEVLAHLRGLK